ncbi:MAG TPA: hypothetical protein VFR38_15745 [Gaiellaceae bacterium]|nr:hypothetical protein [Gaiellaceae bacterium]
MFIVVAHPRDRVAAEAAAALAARVGAAGVALLGVEELALAARWTHVQEDGQTRTVVRLPGGRAIDSEAVSGVVNRIRRVVAPRFRRQNDSEYGTMELFALLLSWLAGLSCRVVNPPSPRGLGGDERTVPQWLRLAGAAGLPTRRVRMTTDGRRFFASDLTVHPASASGWAVGEALHPSVPVDARPALFVEPVSDPRRVTVVGEAVFGAPSAEWVEGCRRLARSARCELLELTIARRTHAPAEWLVSGANPLPEALTASELEALADLLAGARVRTEAR